MSVSSLVSEFFAAKLATSDYAALAESKVSGDSVAPDRIQIIWSEEIDPVAPPLHLYDLTYKVRHRQESDISRAQLNDVVTWVEAQLTPTTLTALVTALSSVGVLNDWFIGSSGSDAHRTGRDYVETAREIRLAIVHS